MSILGFLGFKSPLSFAFVFLIPAFIWGKGKILYVIKHEEILIRWPYEFILLQSQSLTVYNLPSYMT